MNESRLFIVGEGAVARMAMAIACLTFGDRDICLIDLAPADIARFDTSSLGGRPESSEAFAAIGASALGFARFDLWAKFKLAGYRCPSLVHPSAVCDNSATIGENVLVGAGAIIDVDAFVGRGTIVGANAVVAAGAAVSDWCWVAGGAVIGTDASVGAHCSLGVGARVADATEIGDTSELDAPQVFRGKIPPGTFITPEFAFPGARIVRTG